VCGCGCVGVAGCVGVDVRREPKKKPHSHW